MYSICLTSTTGCTGSESTEILEQQLHQIAHGDQEALAELYQRTKSAVYGFVLSILKNTQDAEDVLQEAYIQIFEGAATYVCQGKPMAWILTIARNLSLMKLRERKKTADIPEEDWEKYYSQAPGLSQEDRMILTTLMKSLGDEEQQIVILHAAAGFKHREIAAMLSLPLPTVLSKYHRAIKKLKSKLTEEES